MSSLLAIVYGFLNGVRAMIGLFIPLFAEAADFKRWPLWLKLLIGTVVLTGICIGLYFIQNSKQVDLPFWLVAAPEWLREIYLPLVFMILVALSWLGYWMWLLYQSDEEEADFPEIKDAWDEATRRLARERLTVADLPLFLVLGHTADRLDHLFLAGTSATIVRTPGERTGDDQPPLRVYAWEDGIFVTCPGASAWATFCGKAIYGDEEIELTPAEGGKPINATIGPDGWGEEVGELRDLLRLQKQRALTEEEDYRLRQLSAQSVSKSIKPVNLNDTERNLGLRKLRYLCRLIRQDRRPWCPINGTLLLVPMATTDNPETARHGANILAQEISTVRQTLQLRSPTVALLCDLHTIRGFADFRRRFPDDMLSQRIGQRIPLVPTLKANRTTENPISELVAAAARWIGLSNMPSWILRFLQYDSSPGISPGLQANRNLYHLMRQIIERGPRLGELLSSGVPPLGGGDELAETPLLAGCYCAATGATADQQAFVKGVFERLTDTKSEQLLTKVAWSPEARAADRRLRNLANLTYVGAFLLLLIAGGLVWLLVKNPPSQAAATPAVTAIAKVNVDHRLLPGLVPPTRLAPLSRLS